LFRLHDISQQATILEIGCGMAYLRDVHPNWAGIEFSATAVARVHEKYGADCGVRQGDATRIDFPDGSLDFVYSFATLEHVPDIELAFEEILRVTAPGGLIVLAPAWNCRPWTVKKLQIRPFSDLNAQERVEKALIPIRENLLWRALCSMPARLGRELQLARKVEKIPLDFTPLTPDFSLNERYPHISDDDAFVSIDAHAALAWFISRGCTANSHPSPISRIAVRGEAVVFVKAAR
jgi:SAM-dependent methyltransferase